MMPRPLPHARANARCLAEHGPRFPELAILLVNTKIPRSTKVQIGKVQARLNLVGFGPYICCRRTGSVLCWEEDIGMGHSVGATAVPKCNQPNPHWHG
jgi:hypothetical protein